jgi:hypothetical protein
MSEAASGGSTHVRGVCTKPDGVVTLPCNKREGASNAARFRLATSRASSLAASRVARR